MLDPLLALTYRYGYIHIDSKDIGFIIIRNHNVILKGCNNPFFFNGVFPSETTKNKINAIA